VWARAYHDHAVRHERALANVARYICMNAVRAGLASRPGDYPFWGSPPFSRTLTRRPIEAIRSVHVEAKEVQRGVQARRG
jgi:hypothetical protein